MMGLGKSTATIFAVSALVLSLCSCQKHEGPVESAGKEVDRAASKAGEKIEKAGDKIQDAARGEKK